jgi:hypothetical protein
MSAGLERLRFWLECAAHFAVIASVPFIAGQLYFQERARAADEAQQQQGQRVSAAMSFIQMANDPERTSVRATLSEPWEKLNVAELMAADPTPEGLLKAKTAVTSSVRDSDIEKLTEFYKAVLLCRNGDHCDKKLIDDFFRVDITGFYCAYDHRLGAIAERLNRPDFVNDLKTYAGSCE